MNITHSVAVIDAAQIGHKWSIGYRLSRQFIFPNIDLHLAG